MIVMTVVAVEVEIAWDVNTFVRETDWTSSVGDIDLVMG